MYSISFYSPIPDWVVSFENWFLQIKITSGTHFSLFFFLLFILLLFFSSSLIPFFVLCLDWSFPINYKLCRRHWRALGCPTNRKVIWFEYLIFRWCIWIFQKIYRVCFLKILLGTVLVRILNIFLKGNVKQFYSPICIKKLYTTLNFIFKYIIFFQIAFQEVTERIH